MDIPSPPQQQPPITTTTTSPTPTTTTTTNLDPDPRIQPNNTPKHLPPPFTNGVLKRHKPRHHNHHTPSPVGATYKECLKNHAASMGGHALDGCGEFMPSPTSTPTDPTSFKCAACGCHRNFHRREPDESFPNNFPPPLQHVIEYQPHHRHHPPPPPPQPISIAGARNSISPAESPSPPPISSSYYPSAPHMLLALSTAPPPENIHTPLSAPTAGTFTGSNPNGKKRFRTKFTQDQKQKMQELAERVGWKMQRKDEDLIISICHEIGVEKGVFKVWMHNNKMTLGNKKDSAYHQIDNRSSGGAGIDFLTNLNYHDEHQKQQQQQQPQQNDSISSGGVGNVIGTNGSSSSS